MKTPSSSAIHGGSPAMLAAILAVALIASTASVLGQSIFLEDFDGLTLGPNVDEATPGEQVWTKTPPAGWVQDDTGVPGAGTDFDGVTEWAGWSFADRKWWTSAAGNQRRVEFTKGKGAVMVADPDEWDDQGHPDSAANGWYNTFITTPEISVQGQDANSLVLVFDSSWRPEFDSNYHQTANLTVAFDGGDATELMEWTGDSSADPCEDDNLTPIPCFKDDSSTNETIVVPLNNPAGASNMKLTFGLFDAGNDWWWAVDNVAVGVPPLVTGVAANPVSVTVTITEALGITVNENSVKMKLDGNTVTPAVKRILPDDDQDPGQIAVSRSIVPDFFAPNSVHTAEVTFSASNGKTSSQTVTFKAPDFPSIPATESVAKPANPGFLARITQSETGHGNRRVNVEKQLEGRLGPNIADLSSANANGLFAISGGINWDQDQAGNGNFPDDDPIPGIPGTTGSDDNIAAEIIGVLQLPRGAYRFGVNSDDGFVVTVGPKAKDRFADALGIFDGGRGAADTLFDFAIEEDGFYPFRLVWWEGGGGANVEFFAENLTTGERILINDPNTPGSIKAFQPAPNPNFIDWVIPELGAGAAPDSVVAFNVAGGDDTIDAGSLTLKLDGQDVAATETNNGDGSFTASFTPGGFFDSLSQHTAALSYTVGGELKTAIWDFTVEAFATLPAQLATDLGTGSTPGMKWRTHQLATSRGNSIALAEQQLRGELGADIHDPFQDGPDGFVDIDFVNFEQNGTDAGRFDLDDFIPGIPGLEGGTDNIAGEALTFIEFPSAGLVQMVVNSDDGFKVTMGNAADPQFLELGKFDGGRGSADTVFPFLVEKPGVYQFRLLWFEGGGGANVEWFTLNPDGSRALVNGPQAGALKAFRSRSVPEPDLPSAVAEITGFSVAGNVMTIQWTGNALLQADTVDGTYSAIAGAAPPSTDVTIEASGKKFIKVQ